MSHKIIVSLIFAVLMLVAAWVLKDTIYTKFALIGLVAMWFIFMGVLKKTEVTKNDSAESK